MDGWQERQKQENRALALLLYRYGMTFVPVKFTDPPKIYEVFPLWNEKEMQQMAVAEIQATMERWAAQKITKD